MSNNRSTRSGSQSNSQGSGNLFDINDIKRLINESEARIMSRLDNVMSSISSLEKRFEYVQAEQIRLDLDVKSVKKLVIKQQEYIEKNEKEKRQFNLVFSGISESDIEFQGETLSNDIDKIVALGEELVEGFESSCIASCYRIGKKGPKRMLLPSFYDIGVKKTMLYSQRKLRDDEDCKESFGTI